MLGLPPDHINLIVTTVDQSEVDLHFGVYERMLAEKLGVARPIPVIRTADGMVGPAAGVCLERGPRGRNFAIPHAE